MTKARTGKQDTLGEINRLLQDLVVVPSDVDFAKYELVRAVPRALLRKRVSRARRRLADALVARRSPSLSADLRTRVGTLAQRWAEQAYDEGFVGAQQFELECFQAGEAASIAPVMADAWMVAEEQRHREAIVKEHGKIEIRGLQMSARVFQTLEVAYVPLFVKDEQGAEQVIKLGEGMELRTIPRLRVPEMVGKYERVVLVGAPGSGKSTIVAFLAAQAAAKVLAKDAGWSADPVPFVVPVRSIGKSKIDEATIAALTPGKSVEFVRRVLAERRAFVLIDGIDEAQAGPEALKAHVAAFAAAYPGNRVLTTSRPAGGIDAKPVEISGFVTVTLEPMQRDEVYTFIDRWCLAAEISIQKDEMRAKADAKRAADDLKGRVERSRSIERLAQTPLVCCVLCIVHRFLGQRVPERRAALYEACTNVFLYEWDRAKFPEGSAIGSLDAPAKRFLLSQLARWMHERGLAEASTADVVTSFEATLPQLGKDASEALPMIREIEHRSGILLERRPGYYAFSHLTFQEYLTAVAFVHAGESKQLVKRVKNTFWHEVIALAAGMPGADAAGMIRALLKTGQTAGVFVAANCMETAIELPVALRQEVEEGIKRFVPPRSDADVERLVALGDVVGATLLRALADADAVGRARIVTVLGNIAYEPACGAITRLLSDQTNAAGIRNMRLGELRINTTQLNVGALASAALLNGAIRSPIMREAFERSIELCDGFFLMWVDEALRFRGFATAIGTDGFSIIRANASRIKAAHEAHYKKPTPAAHSD